MSKQAYVVTATISDNQNTQAIKRDVDAILKAAAKKYNKPKTVIILVEVIEVF